MTDTFNSTSVLSSFLRTLAEKVDKDELSNQQLQKTVEFFLRYMFEEKTDEKINNQDFMKFLIMGWYVYENIDK